MGDAWERVSQNFKNIPQNVVDNYTYIFGFAALDFLHSMGRMIVMNNTTSGSASESIASNLLLGTLDTSKFALWYGSEETEK